MIATLAIALWAVLAAIAVLHAAWGLGSHWPCESEESLVRSAGGTPGARRMYPPSACFTVAALLAGVSAWPLFAAGLLPTAWPDWLTLLAGAGIAAVFVARGIAGYLPGWRRLHQRRAVRHARPSRLRSAMLCARCRLHHHRAQRPAIAHSPKGYLATPRVCGRNAPVNAHTLSLTKVRQRPFAAMGGGL